MSSIVVTNDGTGFEWYDDYGDETGDHLHGADDLKIPVTLKKTLTASEKYIECKNDGGSTQFSVAGNGDVDAAEVDCTRVMCEDIIITDGALLTMDAAMAFVPYDNNGNVIDNRTYQFGRNKNIGDGTHEGDGVQLSGLFEKNGADKVCSTQLGILPQEPSLSIRGFKNSGEHYVSIKDENGNPKEIDEIERNNILDFYFKRMENIISDDRKGARKIVAIG